MGFFTDMWYSTKDPLQSFWSPESTHILLTTIPEMAKKTSSLFNVVTKQRNSVAEYLGQGEYVKKALQSDVEKIDTAIHSPMVNFFHPDHGWTKYTAADAMRKLDEVASTIDTWNTKLHRDIERWYDNVACVKLEDALIAKIPKNVYAREYEGHNGLLESVICAGTNELESAAKKLTHAVDSMTTKIEKIRPYLRRFQNK